MKFVEVDKIPERFRATKCNFIERLDEFMGMNVKIAKAVPDECEYINTSACRAAFYYACHKYGYPIDVTAVNGDVYLIRTDM